MGLNGSAKTASPPLGSTPSPYKERPIKIRPLTKASVTIQATLWSLLGITVYALVSMNYQDVQLGTGLAMLLQNFKIMFLEASMKHFTFGQAAYQVLVTVCLALLTTLFGGGIALLLALLSSRNLAPAWVTTIIKAAVTFVRAVPTVLWVLIFAVAAGLGSVAAVVGMTFHSVAYLCKAYSESFEELPDGVIEALKGSGAGWWQIVCQAVLPSSITYLISWTFMRFEINFGVAVAMGAAAGAGGIGYDMFMASSFYLDLREVGAITYFVLAVAFMLEFTATRLKNKLRTQH